jgi:hypothetical protein
MRSATLHCLSRFWLVFVFVRWLLIAPSLGARHAGRLRLGGAVQHRSRRSCHSKAVPANMNPAPPFTILVRNGD